jgi:hypothetical protein
MLLVAPAMGQTSGAQSRPTFGIRAALTGKTTLPGDHFTYGLAAGTEIEDSVVLYNYTDQSLTLSLYSADVRTAQGGALAPAQATDPMKEVGAWTRLDEGTVTVPPQGESTGRFRLKVPEGTVPGDYVGAIVASLHGAPVANGMGLETRAARLIRVNVPGEARVGLSVRRPRATGSGKGRSFDVSVRNTGNVLVTLSGNVDIAGAGTRVPLSPEGIYVIPGGEATLTGRWLDVPTIGRRSATARVAVKAGGRDAGDFQSEPLRLTFFPWTEAALLGAGVGLSLAVGCSTRKRWGPKLHRRRLERSEVARFRADRRAERESASSRAPRS